MRFFLTFAIATFSAIAVSCAAPQLPKPLKTHDDNVVNTFQITCTLELPDFVRSYKKAEAIKMPLLSNNSAAELNGGQRHTRSYNGSLSSGPYTLLLERVVTPNVIADTCGIGAEVKDKQAFHDNVIERLNLKNKAEVHELPNGNQIYYWKNPYGDNTVLSLTEIKNSKKVIVQLMAASPL